MGHSPSCPIFCVLALLVCWRAVSEDDAQCLKEFKNSVKDPKGFLSSWNFSNSTQGYVCSFNGVSCWNVQENKVLGLKLLGAGLSGSFPSGLIQCKALQNLDLSQNDFSGRIPDDVCLQLPYITSLDLSQNSFSGPIPVNLENCVYLRDLQLQQNRLSGELPGGIGILPRLTTLDVSSNLLTGPIPSSYINRSSSSSANPGPPFSATSFANNPGLCGPPLSNSCSSKPNIGLIVGIAVASAAVVTFLCTLCLCWVLLQARKKENALLKDEHKWAKRIKAPKSVLVSLFEMPLVKMRFSDLMAATNDFDKQEIIEEGRTGTVYKAVLADGSMLAVKRLCASVHADKDFQAEMDMLGCMRHKNLVPLLGYCAAGSEKLLVYKHMVNGSLKECLHNVPDDVKPDWIARLKIGIGAARGLAWLHHSCNPRIIHRNISSSSILLDEEYEPRITDFGLARLMNPADTHVSTFVNGDFGDVGYVAPEYSRTLVATVKGDVYSFGVVLLELVTGLKANDVCTDGGGFKGNLSEWVLFLSSNGRLEEALDMALKGGGIDDELNQFVRVASACILPNPKDRPTMYEVYQLLRAIGEKFNITDDEVAVYVDVSNADETDQLIVSKGD
eukprot:c21856_g1_i1 orf=444-2291(+)